MNERGQVAGAEVLLLGVLVFIVGTLLAVNVWAVVDAKLAVTAASREAARTLAETVGRSDAAALAQDAAARAMAAHGRTLSTPIEIVAVDGELRRCARFTVSVEHDVPAVRVPFLTNLGTRHVKSTHGEIVDPYRSGSPGAVDCAD